MSALGQKQTFAMQNGMSALSPQADIERLANECPLRADSGHKLFRLGSIIGAAGLVWSHHRAERMSIAANLWLHT